LKKILKIDLDQQNSRIDKFLKKNFSTLNQSFIEKNLRKGLIKVNNKKVQAKYKLKENDEIEIFNYSEEKYLNIIKKRNSNIPSKILEKFKLSIIYENDDFIILNKWYGISTQGGSKIKLCIDDIIKKISIKYNLVHRLDKETSGLLIIAKNLRFTKFIGNLFKEKKIYKMYLALCQGNPLNAESNVKLKISNKNKKEKNFLTETKYKVLISNKNISVISFNPLTGKTHQIRLVAQHLNIPIIGDTKYNKNSIFSNENLKLNAHILKFIYKDKHYEFRSKLPDDFNSFCKKNKLNFKIEEI